jgi:hypothetical protein
LLLFDDGLQGVGGGAMTAAGVEEDEVEFLADAAIFARAAASL